MVVDAEGTAAVAQSRDHVEDGGELTVGPWPGVVVFIVLIAGFFTECF